MFEECVAGRFEPFTSDYTVREIEDAPAGKREKMIGLISKYQIIVLTASKQANKLAQRYIKEGAFPKGSVADARHVAIATVNSLDKVVSLNFRHIVKERTIELTGAINTLFGYRPVKIVTPMEVIDYEKTRYHTG